MFTASTPIGFLIAAIIGLALFIELLMETVIVPELAELAFWEKVGVDDDEIIAYDFRKPVIFVLMIILALGLVLGLDLNFVQTYADSYGTVVDMLLNAGGLMGLASGLHLALRNQTGTASNLPYISSAVIEVLGNPSGEAVASEEPTAKG